MTTPGTQEPFRSLVYVPKIAPCLGKRSGTIDCSAARLALAELRNEGLVEEQVRGVIRLTSFGYRKYKSTPRSCANAG